MTLLTSQLLSTPSVWRSQNLRTTHRIITTFSSACVRVAEQEEGNLRESRLPDIARQNNLRRDDWVHAVIRGADQKSKRWKHACVFVGLLNGIKSRDEHHFQTSLYQTVERAFVTAMNASLEAGDPKDAFAAGSICVTLSHGFDLLSDLRKMDLNLSLVLGTLMHTIFFSKYGLHHGYFLSNIDAGVVQQDASKFHWSPKTPTFVQFQELSTGPLLSGLGSLSCVMAFAIDTLPTIDLLPKAMTDLSAFTHSLCVQWRQNKLSEVDVSEEAIFLSDVSLRETLPPLWRMLRSCMFAIIVIIRSLLSRTVVDRKIAENEGKKISSRLYLFF